MHIQLLQRDQEMTEELVQTIAPDCTSAVKRALLALKNPMRALHRMHVLIAELCDQLNILISENEKVKAGSKSVFNELNNQEPTANPNPISSASSLADSGGGNNKSTLTSPPESGASSPTPGHQPPTFCSALHLGETLTLMLERWSKLYKDFYSSKLSVFDLSKLPDIYDSVRYDVSCSGVCNMLYVLMRYICFYIMFIALYYS